MEDQVADDDEEPTYLRDPTPLSAIDVDIKIVRQKMSFAEAALELLRVGPIITRTTSKTLYRLTNCLLFSLLYYSRRRIPTQNEKKFSRTSS